MGNEIYSTTRMNTRATPANPNAGGLVANVRAIASHLDDASAETLTQAADAIEALGGGVEADEATVTFALDELDGSDFEAIRGHSKTLRAAIAAMKGQTNAD